MTRFKNRLAALLIKWSFKLRVGTESWSYDYEARDLTITMSDGVKWVFPVVGYARHD